MQGDELPRVAGEDGKVAHFGKAGRQRRTARSGKPYSRPDGAERASPVHAPVKLAPKGGLMTILVRN